MKYASKKDWWLTLIIWVSMPASIASSLWALVYDPMDVGAFWVIIALGVLLPIGLLGLWSTTYYLLDEKTLTVKVGPFSKRIPLDAIKSAKKSNNPLSSPALSLDRIEIRYGFNDMVLISPEDRDEFLEILAQRCPQAKIIRDR